ncbi:hypothetical protein [Bradyrhizobium sp.]|uniref:hypothetical protein n=2 Tax=Bradyrhizobium sp. TaxID=376 RepID=UPI0025BE1595|nr:hypothetical protein [Bradyrhizobium sp.]
MIGWLIRAACAEDLLAGTMTGSPFAMRRQLVLEREMPQRSTQQKRKTPPDSAKLHLRICFTQRSGGMDKLVEIRSQEFLCRERAAFDSERRAFWLAQVEEWEQRALDEIAFHFQECNVGREDGHSIRQQAL